MGFNNQQNFDIAIEINIIAITNFKWVTVNAYMLWICPNQSSKQDLQANIYILTANEAID